MQQPPDNAVAAMLFLTAFAVGIVLIVDTLSNWLR